MSLYSIADMTRMVMHHKKWSQERLRAEIRVSTRQVYKLLNSPECKFRRMPKGAKQIEEIFFSIYANPTPASLRPLTDAIDKVAWLKRNKKKKGSQEALAKEVAHWLMTFSFFAMPDHLTAEGQFAYFTLQGHVYFALACDVQRDVVPEVTDILDSVTDQEAWKRAVAAFEKALQCLNLPTQRHHMQKKYRHVFASAAFNLGAAAFMAYKAGVPGLTREKVAELFDTHVRNACEFFYDADPLDPRAPYNMTCWFSYLEDLDGCRTWFARLIEADPAFADVHTCHAFMRRPMDADPDFGFLTTHLNEIMPTLLDRAA
jgi:hypothetical protein